VGLPAAARPALDARRFNTKVTKDTESTKARFARSQSSGAVD
jgi:hypothetical protein